MASHHLYKIPATIVTGFLGSGKTTIISNILENNCKKRIAVIINEFGDIGIDRTLLEGCTTASCDEIIELTNGCLCCTVADEFLPVMEKLVHHTNPPPDHIIIETSGLALPKPLVQAFQWPNIRARVMVDSVVVIVDVMAILENRFSHSPAQQTELSHSNPIAETFTDQLAYADIVLLNKIDLIEEEILPEIEKKLSYFLRQGVKLLPIRYGRVHSELLLGSENGRYHSNDDTPHPHNDSHHHGDHHTHDDFESFTLTLASVSDIDTFEKSLVTLTTTHNIIRIKGFLDIPGKAMRLVVQGVGTRLQHYFDRPWNTAESRYSRLVVIGLKGLDKQAIATTLGATFYHE